MKKRLLATIPVLLVVFLCSTPVFASTTSSKYTGYINFLPTQSQGGNLGEYFNWYVTRPYFEDYNFNYDQDRVYYYYSNSSTYPTQVNYSSSGVGEIYNVDLVISANFQNADTYLWEGNSSAINVSFSFNADKTIDSYWIECLSDDYEIVSVGNGYIQFKCNDNYCGYNGHFALPRGANTTLSFVVHFVYRRFQGVGNVAGYNTTGGIEFDYDGSYISNVQMSVLAPSSWIAHNDIIAHYNDIVNFGNIEAAMQAINNTLQQQQSGYNNNIQNSNNVTNESSSLQTQSDTVHTQESSYYTQTNTALSNTGLSNFSFSTNVIGGLGKVKDHFTYVWNKLGDYKDVYLFSMTLAIALMIIRHVRPIRRKKEE